MQAERVVTALLDNTDDMVKHLGRLAVNPAYEFEDAIAHRKHLHKKYPAPVPHALDLEIEIKPPMLDFSKMCFITIRWHNESVMGLSKNGGGYSSYLIEHAKEVANLLHQMVQIAKRPHPTGNFEDINTVFHKAMGLRWEPRNTKRRRRTYGYYRESGEGIVKDLLAGAVGFGSFMKSLYGPARNNLAQRWTWTKDWNHAGEITARVFDFGKLTERPYSMTVSLEWIMARGSMRGSHIEINLWDITPSKKVKIVYILRQAVADLEKVANEAEEGMKTVHTYVEDEEMKVQVQRIFNKVSSDLRNAADGFERI